MEKAREIKVKADEEFAIEKVRFELLTFRSSMYSSMTDRVQGKIVRQETSNIDAQYERKRKQADVKKKMCVRLAMFTPLEGGKIVTLIHSATSNSTNKARLSVLEQRDQLLEDVFEEARKKTVELSKDESKYTPLLKALTLQVGFFAII